MLHKDEYLLEQMHANIVVHSLSHVQLFVMPWTAAGQGFLSFTSSCILLKFISLNWWCYLTISSSSTLLFECFLSFPVSGSFLMSQLFGSSGQSIRASASTLALSVNIQSWFPLGFTGLISLLSKELSRVFSSIIIQHHQLLSCLLYSPVLTSVHDY